jgi:cytosine/uracil/thiamine/allantoin permease
MQTPKIQRVIAIMWPSFLMAGAATILFFTAFDPQALLMDTRFADLSRLGAYTIGFFLFWALTAASCLLTCYFQRPCAFRGESENQA